MKLPGYAIQIVLVLMFFAAAGTRFASNSQSLDPYFHGESATHYRHAQKVSEGIPLSRIDAKSGTPEDYRPDRTQPIAMEFLLGYTYKLAKFFSEIDARTYARRFVILSFALCVFTMYLLTSTLWNCQAAGLFAAFMIAFFSPLIEVTNGREFAHLPFALVLVSAHIVTLEHYARKGTSRMALLSAAIALLLLASWELAHYYLAGVVVWWLFVSKPSLARQRWIAGLHLAVLVLGAVTIPYLIATRMLFTWPAATLIACAAYLIRPGIIGARLGAPLAVLLGTLVLSVLLSPLRAGAEAGVPGIQYALLRLRFLFGKPTDPGLLPDVIRGIWSVAHSTPDKHHLLNFFFPLAFMLVPLVDVLRTGGDSEPGGPPRRFRALAILAAVACFAYVLDRGAVTIAAIAVVPILAGALRGVGTHGRTRGPVIVIAAALVLAQVLFPFGAVNATYQIAKTTGVAHIDDNQFMRVSLDNTDEELIRYLAKRTAVSDRILASPDISALITAFSGRTTLLLASTPGRARTERHIELLRTFYLDQKALYRLCQTMDVQFVLYSIDFLLDSTRFSPAYLAGQNIIPDSTVAYMMHFRPETLENFNLAYENDHYRLFKVTDGFEPVFATDHPPVYQHEILEINNDTLESFGNRIVQLILVYSDAMASKQRGDFREALHRFDWCLGQAPRFTLARIGQATTLIQADKPSEARDVLLQVLGYAPDNGLALYHTAYVMVQLEEVDQGRNYLQLLYATTTNQELLDKARLLQAFIDQGIPLTPRTGVDLQ